MNVASWLNQTIYVARQSGVDAYGRSSYGAPFAVKARVERETRLVLSPSGQEHQANDKIACLVELTPTDRVWLPGVDQTDDTESKRPILITSATSKNTTERLWEVFL